MYNATTTSRGMTLIETVLAMVVLGMLLGSVAQGVALSIRMQRSTAERVRGEILATDLLELIIALPYGEPDGSVTIGVDAGESPADRATFDDIDDFHGWVETTPLRADGLPRSDLHGWERSVSVVWGTLGNTQAAAIGETGLKKVSVTVTHLGKKVATVDRLRFQSAQALME